LPRFVLSLRFGIQHRATSTGNDVSEVDFRLDRPSLLRQPSDKGADNPLLVTSHVASSPLAEADPVLSPRRLFPRKIVDDPSQRRDDA
jgi:hypothetical protein